GGCRLGTYKVQSSRDCAIAKLRKARLQVPSALGMLFFHAKSAGQAEPFVDRQLHIVARVIESKYYLGLFEMGIADESDGTLGPFKIKSFFRISCPILEAFEIKAGANISQESFHMHSRIH